MNIIQIIAKILAVVGSLAWGIMGVDILLGNKDSAFNIVHFILGGQGGTFSILEAIVYILVGLSAIYLTIVHLSGDNK